MSEEKPLSDLLHKVDETPEGHARLGIRAEGDKVILAYSRSVAYMALAPEQARSIAEGLCKIACEIDGVETHVTGIKAL